MFRTDLLSIIRRLNTVFTATGICHTCYVDCLLARSGWILTSLACRVVYQNKRHKQCISLAFILNIYNDTRSSEYKINYPSTLTVPQVSATNRHLFIYLFIYYCFTVHFISLSILLFQPIHNIYTLKN
jgi:hypothetical protein